MPDTLVGYRPYPLFVRSDMDDLAMTSKAWRVLCHLARRSSKETGAWPSYQSMGDVCFSKDSDKSETRKKWAMAAVKELASLGLIDKSTRYGDDGQQTSNLYELIDPHPEVGVYQDASPSVPTSTPPVYPDAPKGTPVEGASSKRKTRRGEKSDPSPFIPILVPILYGTTDYSALKGEHWRHVHSIRSWMETRCQPEDLQAWYDKKWKTEWPGNTGRPPRPSEVTVGVAAWLEQAKPKQQQQVTIIAAEDEDEY